MSIEGCPCPLGGWIPDARAAANVDEHDVLPEMVGSLDELLIGGKGYIHPSLKQELAQQNIDLQPPCARTCRTRGKALVSQLMFSRRLVETVIGQLTERFHIA